LAIPDCQAEDPAVPIHATAIVSPEAEIGSDVEIGPFAIVEPGVQVGAGCRLAARTTIKTGVTLGRDVEVCEGTVLGGLPQHINRVATPGTAVIGDRCVLRENVTVHRSLYPDGVTTIGSDCLLMVGAHVAHDCEVGHRVILTNNVLLAGHVSVGDRACLGGAVAVHQYCRVGRLAMIGGCARVVQDVPPFMLTDGETGQIVGLNRVGLRRAGFDRLQVAELKQAYRIAYRQGDLFDQVIAHLEQTFATGPALELAEFFRGGRRGFVQERRSPPKVALRLHPAADEGVTPLPQRKAS
jgi:UDP-N-acetylglucosamine acyltransferase